MRNNLAERIERVLMQDKSERPQSLLPALKSDVRDILRQYVELNQDITLEVQESDGEYNIIMVAKATRFKA